MSVTYQMVGYKVVGSDMKGRNGYEYVVGAIHEQKGHIRLCNNGLHYSLHARDADRYGQGEWLRRPVRYLLVADTEADDCYRHVDKDKIATRSLKVLEELTSKQWQKVIAAEAAQAYLEIARKKLAKEKAHQKRVQQHYIVHH